MQSNVDLVRFVLSRSSAPAPAEVDDAAHAAHAAHAAQAAHATHACQAQGARRVAPPPLPPPTPTLVPCPGCDGTGVVAGPSTGGGDADSETSSSEYPPCGGIGFFIDLLQVLILLGMLLWLLSGAGPFLRVAHCPF